MKGLSTRARDTEVRLMKVRSTRVRHTAVAHNARDRDMKDHDTEALMAMELLVLVLRATPKLCPTQVPSRHPAVTVLPISLPQLRKQSLRCRGQPPRSIVCRTLRCLRITTLRLSNLSRLREPSRKSRQSVCHLQAHGHLLMLPLHSLQSQPLDVVLKHRRPHRMFLGGLRTPLDLLLACLYPVLLLLGAATKISKMMVLETPRQSCQTIASAVSI